MPQKPLLEKLLSPKFLAGAIGMGTAATYVAYRHVDWKSTSDSKQRMLISHLVFWPLCVIALKGMHLSFGLKENWQKALGVMVSSGMVIGAFEGSICLAKKLIPKQRNQPVQSPQGISPLVARQAYQQGLSQGYQLGLWQSGKPVQRFAPRVDFSPSVYKPTSIQGSRSLVNSGYWPSLFG